MWTTGSRSPLAGLGTTTELYLCSHAAQLHGEVTTGVANADHKDPLSPESLRIFVFLAVDVLAFEASVNT